MKTFKGLRNFVVSFCILILLWQVVYWTTDVNKELFPSPESAFRALKGMIVDHSLAKNVGASMTRFMIGYCSSSLVAVVLGLTLGVLPRVFQFVNPIAQLLRPISPTAWSPFLVLWMGIGDVSATVVVAVAAFFPVLLSTVSAVVNVDPIYFKVAKNFGVRQPYAMWKIVFPAAFPMIANGLHTALGSAWIFLVAGEMLGVKTGLGFMIVDARQEIRPDAILATIFVIGVLGLALDAGLKVLEKLALWLLGGGGSFSDLVAEFRTQDRARRAS